MALFICICVPVTYNILYLIGFSAFLFSNVSSMKAESFVCFSPRYRCLPRTVPHEGVQSASGG